MRPVAKVLVLAGVLTGFSFPDHEETNPAPSSHVLEIRQLQFQPAELTVAVGDTVVWINGDIVPHTVSELDDDWSSDGLKKDGSWQRVMHRSGVRQYYCKYHPNMRGSIVVK